MLKFFCRFIKSGFYTRGFIHDGWAYITKKTR